MLRNGENIWEKPFLTGETNMSHTLANLEHHHFKYALFRRKSGTSNWIPDVTAPSWQSSRTMNTGQAKASCGIPCC